VNRWDMRNRSEARWSRRQVLAAAGALGVCPVVLGQTVPGNAVLPLDTTGLEHLGLSVPDVERSGQFYARLFNPALHREREPPLRYYVPFRIGYLAIGAAGDRPTQIDHYCALVEGYDPAVMAAALERAGLPASRFGMIPDPDGLRLQLLGVPGGLAPSTEPAGRVVADDALVSPIALEHVSLRVSSLETALPFYRTFFGSESPRASDSAGVRYEIADTRLHLRPAAPGELPRIEHFCVNVATFDERAVIAGLERLGATIDSGTGEEADILRFHDPDGITVELRPMAR
jgi:catechol 2,3-dioxygenase-like lactoylglutathione lyase family enzyme